MTLYLHSHDLIDFSKVSIISDMIQRYYQEVITLLFNGTSTEEYKHIR